MSIKSEVKRKALHLTGLTVPLLYLLFGQKVTIGFVATALIVFIILEPFRIVEELRDKLKQKLGLYVREDVIALVERELEAISREHEKYSIGSHIYFTIGALIIISFFPKDIAIGAITVATLGDAIAAIIGKPFGKHRFKNGKSIEGSLAYFLTAFLILLVLIDLPHALIGALAGMLAEFYELPPDDNLSNQLAVAITIYVFRKIF
ncbi:MULTISPECIES: diacylglycerol/polyprenol kinase family protein [Thermococcus]|uniref:Phosphatidate cytidylyltransferase n=1 Tax=Thermococcus sibiricus TaxID=172049 RepID=A0A101EMX1_9EURY|nr:MULTISPECIES: diacylglycerol/polyprenol kinase family protein [Thermococcus]KUK18329.1 MAG: Phosphatidate cytidylyltransferase [Thermococcus sibiricus]KUK28923.1 MAG: Phosphatidate cytidylyltransferase [Thermococcus sp. 40_45]MBC7094744.1 phosphatidate cytidylyltransferase [Thermococcus sp.]HII66508.1 phosphatidate cytidylyltransferase [Thermococcaceae archaeon]